MGRPVGFFVRIGVVLTLFGIAVNALVVCVELGITHGEMTGHSSDGELGRLALASNIALVAALCIECVVALLLDGMMRPARSRVHRFLRVFLLLTIELSCSVGLTLVSISTGGAFVYPPLADALNGAIRRMCALFL